MEKKKIEAVNLANIIMNFFRVREEFFKEHTKHKS